MSKVVVTRKALKELASKLLGDESALVGSTLMGAGAVAVCDGSGGAGIMLSPEVGMEINNQDPEKSYDEDDDEETMKEKMTEAMLRAKIRSILKEVVPSDRMSGLTYSGPEGAGFADSDDDKPVIRPRRTYKSTAQGSVADVEGSSFEEIASELGLSVAGAKQAVDKAMLNLRVLAKMEPDELKEFLDDAAEEYIDKLIRHAKAYQDPLSDEEITFLRDNKDDVKKSEEFREFLSKKLRGMRGAEERAPEQTRLDQPEDLEPAADVAPSPARTPSPSTPASVAKAKKDAYKIYPGGKRYGGAAAVTRYKGKVYKSADKSEFKPGEQGVVSAEDGKLKVKKVGSDHTQVWEPFEEAYDKKDKVLFGNKLANEIPAGTDKLASLSPAERTKFIDDAIEAWRKETKLDIAPKDVIMKSPKFHEFLNQRAEEQLKEAKLYRLLDKLTDP